MYTHNVFALNISTQQKTNDETFQFQVLKTYHTHKCERKEMRNVRFFNERKT